MLTTIETNRLPVESFQFDLQRACGAFSVEPVKGQSLVKGIVQLEKRAGLEIAHVAKDLQTIQTLPTKMAGKFFYFFLLLLLLS